VSIHKTGVDVEREIFDFARQNGDAWGALQYCLLPATSEEDRVVARKHSEAIQDCSSLVDGWQTGVGIRYIEAPKESRGHTCATQTAPRRFRPVDISNLSKTEK
jgi:hypothetical protein